MKDSLRSWRKSLLALVEDNHVSDIQSIDISLEPGLYLFCSAALQAFDPRMTHLAEAKKITTIWSMVNSI